MKHIIILLITLITIASCSKKENEMRLTGTVDGLKKGTLLLQKVSDSTLVSLDSVVINGDSNFLFSEEIKSPEIYYLYVRLKDGSLMDDRISFFAEPGDIIINTTLENFEVDAQISGAKNQGLLKEYKKLANRYADKNLDLIEQSLIAQQEGNSTLVDSISQAQKSVNASRYLMTVNFAMNHKDAEVAPYLLLSEVFDANIKYLDTVYGALTPKIKDSKYGKVLESFIENRKKEGI